MDESNEQKIEFLVKVIHDIQWKGESLVTPQHRRVGTCPMCGSHDIHRHGCRVALALTIKPTPVDEKLEDEPESPLAPIARALEAKAAAEEAREAAVIEVIDP